VAKQQELIKSIIESIDSAVDVFSKKVPKHQQRILDDISLLLKDLDLRGDSIQQNAKNLKAIGAIKGKLEQIINSDAWMGDVKEYLKSFNEVTKLQNQYFSSLKSEFKPTPLLTEIKKQSLDSTFDSLTERGINSVITDKVQDILRKAITSGSSYTQTMKQLREYVVTNKSGAGALERYTKQITTDALNQYSAQYTNAVTNDLGLDWFMYTGALIDTSRTFCQALIKKKYIHKSELPAIILGKFKEFEDMDGEINPKTDLPQGMIAGTNVANFHIYRGGYQCGHQMIPVDEGSVPEQIRMFFDKKAESKFDKKSANLLIHKNADKASLSYNTKHAETLAEKGQLVVIPELKSIGKNPDVIVNGKNADFKQPVTNGHRGIRSGISSSNTQGSQVPIFVFDDRNYSKSSVIRALNGEISKGQNRTIEEVWLLYKGRLIKISREEIMKRSYYDKLP